ncbi:dihydrofolate reductase family protein [Roseibium salinum]|uniref:Dihydrofolate reductase family protein n=1 Tax=Roseibium salinum TaxID=1604349 RepID=A0ABT3R2D5_9HYPH|nr:dihydrofolate reductase family protein [Roseibium sp. DSM 29163]MCX2723373.1 dihydrofolate reductase family protein [Roseibium sp. DSM 29163]
MSKLRVCCFGVSLDGYGAGPSQDLENPLGIGGMAIHEWFFPTRTFQSKVLGNDGGETGPDDDFARQGFENVGSWILGRNMFGPIRGEWPDDEWKGWWGDNPPYQTDVFVLTHYPRDPVVMEGGTTFHFVTDGIEAALERARASAAGKDVRLGGGVSTIRQYLSAGLVDEMHIVVAPTLLGKGENLFSRLDLPALGYQVSSSQRTKAATHVTISRQG